MAAKVTEMSGSIYCLNLSAAFIVQVPSFRAVLEKAPGDQKHGENLMDMPTSRGLFCQENTGDFHSGSEFRVPLLVFIFIYMD